MKKIYLLFITLASLKMVQKNIVIIIIILHIIMNDHLCDTSTVNDLGRFGGGHFGTATLKNCELSSYYKYKIYIFFLLGIDHLGFSQ